MSREGVIFSNDNCPLGKRPREKINSNKTIHSNTQIAFNLFTHSVKNNGVLDGVMDRYLTEYSSHALAEFVDGGNRNYWIL